MDEYYSGYFSRVALSRFFEISRNAPSQGRREGEEGGGGGREAQSGQWRALEMEGGGAKVRRKGKTGRGVLGQVSKDDECGTWAAVF